MNKIVEYFAETDNVLKAILILFFAGLAISFFGLLIISLVSSIPIMIFGGIVTVLGCISLFGSVVMLAGYLGNL